MGLIYFNEETQPGLYIDVVPRDLISNVTDIDDIECIKSFTRSFYADNDLVNISSVSRLDALPDNISRVAIYVRDLSANAEMFSPTNVNLAYTMDIGCNVGGSFIASNDVSFAPDTEFIRQYFAAVLWDGLFYEARTMTQKTGYADTGLCSATSTKVDKLSTFNFTLDTNIPVFTDFTAYTNFLTTGEGINLAVNYNGSYVSPDVVDPYYIGGETYRYNEGERILFSEDDFYWFKIPYGAKLYGYVTDDVPYNIRLVTDATSFWYYVGETEPEDDDWIETDSFPANRLWTYDGKIVYNQAGSAYIGALRTNITILADKLQADRYQAGELDESEIPGNRPGIGGGGVPNPTGTKTRQQLPEATNMGNILSTVYYGGRTVMNQVANKIYSTDTDIIEQIKTGLSLFGQNPIEFLLDCYYLPIDISDFCAATSQSYVMFGGYHCDLTSDISRVSTNSKIKRLFSEKIYPVYEDYRQYFNISYKLYLPYIGMVELDTAVITGTTLSADAVLDLRSHNLKYYVHANGQLIGEYETSIGVQMPLIATDFAGKAQQNIQAIGSLTASAVGIAAGGISTGLTAGVGAGITAMGRDAIGEVAGNSTGLMGSVQNLTAKPASIRFGNISSATGCFDPSYAFLIIDEVLTEEPEKLHATYGKPCDRIATMGQSSGFTQVEDIRITGPMTEEERRELEMLCRNGIII